MKTAYSHDYFYYGSDFKNEHNDFTGDNSLTPQKRMDFLKNYADFLEKYYDLPETPQEVITDSELKELYKGLNLSQELPTVSKRLEIDEMNATLVTYPQKYKNWHIYTNKARIKNGKIIFDSDNLPPTSAAAYFFDGSERVKEFTFTFKMNKEYSAEIPGGILDTTYGRTVELRSGIEDVIKLQFYSNGSCYARLGNACSYHLKNVFIGNFNFEEEQKVTLNLEDKYFTVKLCDTVSPKLELSSNLNPNMLFIGCGMFNVGGWVLKPEKLVTDKNLYTEFFAENDNFSAIAEPKGKVLLPYSVGGYENRNKSIVLEKKFYFDGKSEAFLNIDALDPCGSVFINERFCLRTDGFDKVRTEITDFLKKGENDIKIIVDPRAPEVLFNWHRQKDAYNGWFCDRVWIDFYNKIKITDVKVLTLETENENVSCRIEADVSENCDVKVYLRKIFPERAETENLIGEISAKENKIDKTINFKADLWTPDTPNLYAVRLEALDEYGNPLDDAVCETGFRTICQKNGQILLNGKPLVLTGALLMQFLPPYNETPVTHICASCEQILWQELMLKRMNGNTMRIHILGYGTNDARYARIADRIGLMLIWTTRYIDSVEQMALQSYWAARDGYLKQISERINHPSIIMWEGTNEYHPTLSDIDRIYEAFVPAVKTVDTTRLLSPISHLYYAGDMIPKENCAFYNDDGTADHIGNEAKATNYWNDELVIRSAHTYEVLLGYGTPWKKMRNQEWSMQEELFESQKHAYVVTEFAVTARQNPNSKKAQEYFNHYSYEFPDEDVLGFRFKENEWRESQAYQALAAKFNVKVMREHDADGMLWCCLMGGANDGGYLKPPIDCYGYPKYAFYTLKEGYSKLYSADASLDALRPLGFEISPTVFGTEQGARYKLTVTLTDNSGNVLEERRFDDIIGNGGNVKLPAWKPNLKADGYYALLFKTEEL